jgi:hypothetical protein
MLSMKAAMLAVLLSFALNGAASCDAQKKGSAKDSNQKESNQPGNRGASGNSQPEKQTGSGDVSNDLKTLAAGQHSPVSNAFIAVARDAETYGALRKLISNLPEQEQNFFNTHLVVAAFLGERRTGGYSVRFTRTTDGTLRVDEAKPPKGSITAQVITYPFAVVAMPFRNPDSLMLETASAWQSVARRYDVKSGEFTMSGGIMGRSERFGLRGSIAVLREANLATFILELQGNDRRKPRVLREVASGVVQSDGRVVLANISAGTLVEMPADLLRATVMLTENESKFSLSFESIPGRIADGFNGRGSLDAEAASPAPRKNRAATEDAPQ